MPIKLLIEQFLRERRVLVGVTARTLGWHSQSLGIFELSGYEEPQDITKQRLLVTIEQMLDRGVSPITINSYLRSVNAFLKWLHDEGLIERRVHLSRLIEPQPVPVTWTDEEIVRYCAYRPHRGSRYQRRLMVYLIGLTILDTGLRIRECLQLAWDDVNLDEAVLCVRMGKGQRGRKVPITPYLAREIRSWGRFRPLAGLLYPSSRGTPLGYQNIDGEWRAICAAARVRPVGFHAIRHTFATMFIKNGGDVLTLQRILGHASLEMTKRYVTLQTGDLAAKQLLYGPLAKIKLR